MARRGVTHHRGDKPKAATRRRLPMLRFEIAEAARILRMSRAQLYRRIQQGCIVPQKDGGRTYITRAELERYVEACNAKRTDC